MRKQHMRSETAYVGHAWGMASQTWVAVDIAFRLEVVDEGALVHAALTDLESADGGIHLTGGLQVSGPPRPVR